MTKKNLGGIIAVILLLGSIFTVQATVTTDDLIGYWSFDVDGTDDYASNDATIVNAVIDDAEVMNNNSLNCDGTGDYAYWSAPNTKFVNVTYSFWMHPDTLVAGERYWLDNIDDYMYWNRFSGSSDTNPHIFRSWDTTWSDVDYGVGVITAHDWYYIVINHNETNIDYYINGAWVGTDTGIAQAPTNYGARNLAFCGSGYTLGSGNTNVHVDEVAFFERTLTPEEITELYNSGSGWFYPFDEIEVPPKPYYWVEIEDYGNATTTDSVYVWYDWNGNMTYTEWFQDGVLIENDSSNVYNYTGLTNNTQYNFTLISHYNSTIFNSTEMLITTDQLDIAKTDNIVLVKLYVLEILEEFKMIWYSIVMLVFLVFGYYAATHYNYGFGAPFIMMSIFMMMKYALDYFNTTEWWVGYLFVGLMFASMLGLWFLRRNVSTIKWMNR